MEAPNTCCRPQKVLADNTIASFIQHELAQRSVNQVFRKQFQWTSWLQTFLWHVDFKAMVQA
jgi:hypothetical protein